MKKAIDITKEVYFYDDRNQSGYFYKMKKILYQDEQSCLCIGKATEDSIEDEKIFFDIHTGEVNSSELYSWLATNDTVWIEEKIAKMLEDNNLSISH